MPHSSSIIFEYSLDKATLKILRDIRKMRVETVRDQLEDLPETVYQLIRSGAVEMDKAGVAMEQIKDILVEKAERLTARMDHEAIYSDEIEIYLDLMSRRPIRRSGT